MSTATETQTGDTANKPGSERKNGEASSTNETIIEERNREVEELKTATEKLKKEVAEAQVMGQHCFMLLVFKGKYRKFV